MSDPNLTEALAQKNPNAYRARFKRLSIPQQQAHANALSPQAYAAHCTALGEAPTVRMHLSGAGAQIEWLRVEFGGLRATFEKLGWEDAAKQLRTVLQALSNVPVAASLMLGADDRVVSGAMSNVFIANAGVLSTPLVDHAGVAGVMRGIVMRECATLGLTVIEKRLTLEDLFAASEVFVTNARIGVVSVRRVGEHAFGMNELALRLSAHIEKLDA